MTATELLQSLYQYGVPLINIMLVPLIVVLWIANIKTEHKPVQAVVG